jgi:hypothetical protein
MHKGLVVLGLGAVLLAPLPAAAQEWAIGFAYGIVTDVEDDLRLDEFDPRDVTGWVEYRLENQVRLRGAFGSMKADGDAAGEQAALVPGAPPSTLPELRARIDYATIGVAYQFWEGNYTSGLFGGIGGYKVNPDPAPPGLANFRDRHETVFGWHLGVDADVRILSRLSLIGRLTYHKIRSETGRSLLSATAGMLYRF